MYAIGFRRRWDFIRDTYYPNHSVKQLISKYNQLQSDIKRDQQLC